MTTARVWERPEAGHRHFVRVDGWIIGYLSADMAEHMALELRQMGHRVETGRAGHVQIEPEAGS